MIVKQPFFRKKKFHLKIAVEVVQQWGEDGGSVWPTSSGSTQFANAVF